MNITLLGYMGCGKSSVGRALAERLGCEHVDLDTYIEAAERQSIGTLFTVRGAVYFRRVEREALHSLLAGRDQVLSLGGGTPAYYDNMAHIKRKSRAIYLKTPVKDLTERLLEDRSHRPLIAAIKAQELGAYIAKQLFERSAYYQQAELTIENDNRHSVLESVQAILERL